MVDKTETRVRERSSYRLESSEGRKDSNEVEVRIRGGGKVGRPVTIISTSTRSAYYNEPANKRSGKRD